MHTRIRTHAHINTLLQQEVRYFWPPPFRLPRTYLPSRYLDTLNNRIAAQSRAKIYVIITQKCVHTSERPHTT